MRAQIPLNIAAGPTSSLLPTRDGVGVFCTAHASPPGGIGGTHISSWWCDTLRAIHFTALQRFTSTVLYARMLSGSPINWYGSDE